MLPDGGLDLSFNPGTGANGWVYAIALQPDGKVLIGGDFTQVNGIPRAHIARLNTNGVVDVSFNPGSGASDRVTTIAVQPDGKILAGGWFTNFNGFARSRLVRLETNGAVDTELQYRHRLQRQGNVVVVQPDTRILVGGWFNTNNGAVQRKLVRLLSNGAVDAGFTTTWARASAPVAHQPRQRQSIALQPDGKVVVAGEFAFYNNVFRANLARVLADGQIDTNFTAGVGVFASSVIAPADGSIAVAGNFSSFGNCYFVKLLANTGLSAPVITVQPASQTNLFGAPTTFTVSALGGGLSYQWQKEWRGHPRGDQQFIHDPLHARHGCRQLPRRCPEYRRVHASDVAVLTVTVTPDFDWSRRFGATGNSGGRGVVADAYGNTYVSGFYGGTATVGTNNLISAGGQDIFLARYDSAGNPVWARSAGSTLNDLGWAVATDPAGNVVLAGSFAPTQPSAE